MSSKMTVAEARVYRAGEFHRFEAAGHEFLYLVPAGAIFELDQDARSVIEILNGSAIPHGRLISEVTARGIAPTDAEDLVDEMYQARAIVTEQSIPEPAATPPVDFPLQSLVMNLTNQCNLSCQ